MNDPDQKGGRIRNTVFQMHKMQLHLPREQLSAPLVGSLKWSEGRVKVEKISGTYVSSIDTKKREVYLEGSEAIYRYADDSMILLLEKAMTRKATFIVKDQVISWIELKGRARPNAATSK